MKTPPSLPRLRLISDEELEAEMMSGAHDEATRHAILFERMRRLAPARVRSQSNALNWVILLVALVGAILAGIAAFPVLADAVDKDWFDF